MSSALREAAQQALAAMDYMLNNGEWYQAQERADALRAALAQKQEPVAWQAVGGSIWGHKTSEDDRPLYTLAAKSKQETTMITQFEQTNIAELVNNMTLCTGLGNTQNACSIAAINLALTGQLTDEIPECMSEVIGNWIVRIQDSMPDSVRNSTEWKTLLPLAAGTGRSHEAERIAVILNWMWADVLPILQPVADQYSFGKKWQAMCIDKTSSAARAAACAADAADAAATAAARAAATAARAAARAARAAATAARAAATAAAWADTAAARAARAAATAAARAAAWADTAAADADFWTQVDPAGLLKRLVEVTR